MQFMQHQECIKCIKRWLIVSKKAFSFYVLSTSFLRLFYVMGIWRLRKVHKLYIFLHTLLVFFLGGGGCVEKDITERICSSAKPITMRDASSPYAHRASLSLRHRVLRTCLTLHVSTSVARCYS